MPEKIERSLYEEKVVGIDGAIFPTIEDEIFGLTSYTAYIPISDEIKKLIKRANSPFKLKVTLASPKKLSEGELERMKAIFTETMKAYEGELELKKRLRWKGLKISSIIESGFLIGNYYPSVTGGWGFGPGLARFIGEFVFWGMLIFIPSVIGPFIGGLRYVNRQKGIEKFERNLRGVELSVKTDEKMIHDIMKEYSKIDDVKIYEKMGSYAEKAGYKLAHEFYKKLKKTLAAGESFVTKYLPSGFVDGVRAVFDIRVDTPDFYAPIGEVEE